MVVVVMVRRGVYCGVRGVCVACVSVCVCMFARPRLRGRKPRAVLWEAYDTGVPTEPAQSPPRARTEPATEPATEPTIKIQGLGEFESK